jgi:hypothetical protein
MWQQHLEDISDCEDPNYNAVTASLAKYSQYLFNLQ